MYESENKNIKNISLYFTILCALFLMLSSQFTGFVLPLLFIIPIYMGLTGIKHKRKSGYLIAVAIVPLSTAVSVLWIRYFISVFNNRVNEIAKISKEFNISNTSTEIMSMSFFLLSLIMLSISIIIFIKLQKNKKLFK